MKKWTAFLAVFSLLFVGTLVIYKEAIAKPYDCDMVESYCVACCSGNFSLSNCVDQGSYIECDWLCEDMSVYGWPCPWCEYPGCPDVFGTCWL